MDPLSSTSGRSSNGPRRRDSLEKLLSEVQRRLLREASLAFGMLEQSVALLWSLDHEAAADLRNRDDRVDAEEVAIEQACMELLALQQPMARDLRLVSFVLRVNADLERVADHSCSIAKVVIMLHKQGLKPAWPTAFVELAERVPLISQRLLRAVVDEDMTIARQIILDDETIDRLHDRVFEETVTLMRLEPEHPEIGLLIHRATRELERVADLMASVAEAVVYLATGDIVRHGKRLARAAAVLQASNSGDEPAKKPSSNQAQGGSQSESA
jgi:phosphate transport system protein